jgi:hypothetical protein
MNTPNRKELKAFTLYRKFFTNSKISDSYSGFNWKFIDWDVVKN